MTPEELQLYAEGPDAFTWLQAWYVTQCDGDWEHEYGLSIETLDNPGWFLKVDLARTAMTGRPYEKQEVRRGDHDWLTARVVEDRFEVACGPLNLGEAVHHFRVWVAAAS